MQGTSVQLEQGEAGNTTYLARNADGNKVERTVWTALLLLPLVTYCVVAVLAFTVKPTPNSTGDPLYDKYIAWVADDLAQSGGSILVNDFLIRPKMTNYQRYRRRLDTTSGGVDFDPFAGWEAKFKDDPRYWMLRYRYTLREITKSGPNRSDVIGHLEQARELEVADGAILLMLLRVLDSQTRSQSNYTPSPGLTELELMSESEKHSRNYVDEQMGAEHDQLLAELLEVAGNNSLPHYYSAMFDSLRGDYEAAIKHLSAGNRAPMNSSLEGFPIESIRLDIQSGQPLPDELVGGSIYLDGEGFAIPNLEAFIQMVELLLAQAASTRDRSALNEIHKFSCRFGNTGGSDRATLYCGLRFLGRVESEFKNNFGGSLTAGQTANLTQLGHLKGQINSQMHMQGSSYRQVNPLLMTPWPKFVWLTESELSGGRSGVHEFLDGYHDIFHNRQTTLVSVNQLFEQMESFNYNTLEFE